MAALPDPVDCKYFFVVVVLPCSREAVPVPLSYSTSPIVVIGVRALNAAAAVVCPVPPLAIAIEVPFHVPEVTVPTLVILPCTAAGRVAEIDGTLLAFVTRIPLAAVVRPETAVPFAA